MSISRVLKTPLLTWRMTSCPYSPPCQKSTNSTRGTGLDLWQQLASQLDASKEWSLTVVLSYPEFHRVFLPALEECNWEEDASAVMECFLVHVCAMSLKFISITACQFSPLLVLSLSRKQTSISTCPSVRTSPHQMECGWNMTSSSPLDRVS